MSCSDGHVELGVESLTKSNANSDTLTEGVRIQAAAQFMPERSEPDEVWFFAYRIRITNEGEDNAQLLSRHWVVLDSNNGKEEVMGEGVVGRQPDLGPGEMFEYTSGCPLGTAWGTMEGRYTFRRPDGTEFEVPIGRFFLVTSVDNADALGS